MAIVTDVAIGAKVREWRTKRKVSQPELAETLSVSPMMVQHYETGRNPLTVVKLVIIARRLKCKVTDLIP